MPKATAVFYQKLQGVLIFEDVEGIGAQQSVPIQEYDRSIKLSGTTTPPVDNIAFALRTLAAGTELVDLTAAPTLNGTFDATGAKVQMASFYAPSTNAAALVIDVTGANPLDCFGAAWSISLAPGGGQSIYTANAGSAIAAGIKTFEINGTIGDKLFWELVVGTPAP